MKRFKKAKMTRAISVLLAAALCIAMLVQTAAAGSGASSVRPSVSSGAAASAASGSGSGKTAKAGNGQLASGPSAADSGASAGGSAASAPAPGAPAKAAEVLSGDNGGNAVAVEFSDAETAEVEALLGYTVKGAHKKTLQASSNAVKAPMRILVLQSVSNSDYRFDAYYIKYDNNSATTKTDAVQDLIGNMDPVKQTFKYQLDFHNDTDYAVGDVVIRIPNGNRLYTDRDGTAVKPSSIGIPLAPGTTTSSAFNYTVDGDDLVVTNCKPIAAGSNNLIQIFYSLDDMLTVDGTAWTIQPAITVRGQDGGSVTLTGSMDTKTVLSKTAKKAYEQGDVTLYPELYTLSQVTDILGGSIALPAQVTNNPDSYRIMVWQTEIAGEADQPWTLTAADAPQDNGIVLGQALSTSRLAVSSSVVKRSASSVLSYENVRDYNLTYYLYTVTAYPVDQTAGKAGANRDDVVHNDISVTLKGTDDGIVHSLSGSNQWSWTAFDWEYSGDMIGTTKDYGGLTVRDESALYNVYQLQRGNGADTPLPHDWHAKGVFRGYDLICPEILDSQGNKTGRRQDNSSTATYTLYTVDDIQYASNNVGSGRRELDYQDYYYTSVNVRVRDYAYDIYNSKYILQDEGLGTKVEVMAADHPGVWQTAAANVPYAQIYNGGRGWDMPSDWMAKGIYRIRAVHSSNDYETDCNISGNTALRAASPVLGQLISAAGASQLTVENLSGVYGTATAKTGYIQDQNTTYYGQYAGVDLLGKTTGLYGTVLMRDAASAVLTGLQGANNIKKTGTAVNNAADSQVDLTYQITAYDGYMLYGEDGEAVLKANGITVGRNTATFYDLLPKGVLFDPTAPVTAGIVGSPVQTNSAAGSIAANWKQQNVSVATAVTQDYHGSGRELVAFTLTYSGEDSSTFFVDYGDNANGKWVTAWGVQFGAYYPWRDSASCSGAQNTAAFQTPDAMKGSAYPDDGSGAPASSGNYIGDLDLDGNTAERNVIYSTAAVAIENAVSASSGISKLVKEDADLYNLPFLNDDGVQCGQTYTYYVTLSTSNSTLSNIVLFDRLENAAASRGNNEQRDFDSNYWYGTFVKVNTDELKKLDLDVKVYYSANRAVAYPTDVNNGSPGTISADYLTAAKGWTLSTDWTLGASAVKAIAIDITKKTNGSYYTLAADSALSYTIQMRAPAVMQDMAAGNTSANYPNAPAVYAYNNPAWFGTTSNAAQSTTDTVIGNSTSIPLVKPASLSVEKNAAGAEAPAGQSFSFTVEVDGAPYAKRQYSLWQKNTAGTFEEVTDGVIRTTDADGGLKLTADQKAVFDGVPAGKHYSITEKAGIHWTTAAAGGTGTTNDLVPAEAVFTNTYHPIVYFDKTVRYATESTNPDDTFTFELKINGTAAAGRTYYLVDPAVAANREPVILKRDGSGAAGTLADDALAADALGRFTLKAGQRIAVPLDSGEQYEFTETGMSSPDDYITENGTAGGAARAPYTSAGIVNDYKWKDLYVSKTVKNADGDVILPDEEFSFTVVVGGTPYSGSYTLTNSDGTTESRTMSGGAVSLKGGQKLRIDHIASQTPYRITENLTEAQREYYVSSGNPEGVLPKYAESARAEVVNTDKRGGLKVSKSVLFDAAAETAAKSQPFTFTVYLDQNGDGTAADNEVLASHPYTLTAADGTVSSASTGTNGAFTLKHGETAYFAAINDDTVYRVVEQTATGYTQEIPANGAAASGTVSAGSGVSKAPFVNRPNGKTFLTVTKNAAAGINVTEEELNTVLENQQDYAGYNSGYYEYLGSGDPSFGGVLDRMTSLFQVLVDKGDGAGYVAYTGGYTLINSVLRTRTGMTPTTVSCSNTWFCLTEQDGVYSGFTSTRPRPRPGAPSATIVLSGLIPLYPGETFAITGLDPTWKFKVLELDNVSRYGTIQEITSARWTLVSPQSGYAEGTLGNYSSETFTNELDDLSDMVLLEKWVNGVSLNGSPASDYSSFINKTLTWQVYKSDGNGGWIPAAGQMWFDEADNILARSDPSAPGAAQYADADGKIAVTCTQNGTVLRMPVIGLPVTDARARADKTLAVSENGYTINGQTEYKVVEVPEETDPVFGTFDAGMYAYSGFNGYSYYRFLFNNAAPDETASFIVKKQAEGVSAPDTAFTYTLYSATLDEGASRVPMPLMTSQQIVPYQPYTLWDGHGTDDAADDTQITDNAPYATDANGTFTLKAGQYAKFTGMKKTTVLSYVYGVLQGADKVKSVISGTVYRVAETPLNGWSVAITRSDTTPPEAAGSYITLLKVRPVIGTDEYNYLKMTPGTGWVSGGITDSLTYTNTWNPSPDLKVTKALNYDAASLTSAQIAAIKAQDFTFALLVDQNADGKLTDSEYYADQTYRLYNANGTEVLNTQTINGVQVDLPWTTDEYGEFRMKANQYVVFQYLGTGRMYRVTETPTDGYTQISPADGTAAEGTMTSTGAQQDFVNHYGTARGSITVRKALSWPAGIRLPDDIAFTFELDVNGAPYSGQEFTAYDSSTNAAAGADGSTDANGRFTLKANQYAVFRDVVSGVDYEAKELIDTAADYWLVTSSGTAGATADTGVTAAFTNGLADFLVGKSVVSSTGENAPSGDQFTFTLTLNGAAAADQPYVLCDAAGNRTGTGQTDANGQFAVTSGQRALFTGIKPGTAYNVRENFKQYYTQTVPANASGYSGTVDGTSVPDLTFENNYARASSLSVTKKVTGDQAPADTGFTFRIETKVGGAYVLYAGKTYYTGTAAYQTDANGEFRLKADETAVFRDLPVGTEYRVKEIGIPPGFTAAAEEAEQAGTLTLDGAALTVTNHYEKVISVMLPATGGTFLWWFILFCYAGAAFAVLSLMFSRKRRPKRASAPEGGERDDK